MAVASVKKIELYVHRSAVSNVLSVLQERGFCDISASEKNAAEESASRPVRNSVDYAAALNDVNYLVRMLSPYYTDPVGALARVMGERDDVSVESLAALSEKVDVRKLASEIRVHERRLTELHTEIGQEKALHQTLSGVKSFQQPLSIVTEGSRLVAAFLGTGRQESLTAWKDAVLEALGEDAECEISFPEKGSSEIAWGCVYYLRSKESVLQEICLRHNISKVEIPSAVKGTVADELAASDRRLAALDEEEKSVRSQLRAFAESHMDSIRRLGDYLTIMKDREEAELRSEHTDQVVLLKGWAPVSREKELREALSAFESDMDLRLSDPTEDDDPPILLENRPCAKPFGMLTMLYGAPAYGSVDPSFPMMPFFLLFFGMCYADAGYGLIIMGIAMYFLKKYRRMPDSIRQALILVKYCGIATILFGAVTGAWMGDMIDVFPFLRFLKPLKDFMTLLEPMKSPMLLLGISLALGIVHVYWGIILAAYNNVKHGQILAACADQGGWLCLLTGLLIFGVGSAAKSPVMVAGKYTAWVGAAVLVLTQGREKKGIIGKLAGGVLSLYNVTGYMGDVLSYSRLLALGLVGGAVSMIINLMSSLTAGTAYVGWIIALIIFAGGHIASMAINILGAFVHPLRLQYVEFFGKFYQSGGHAYKPFCYKNEYVNISGEKEAK